MMSKSIFVTTLLFVFLSISCQREETPILQPALSSSCDLICKSQFPIKGDAPQKNESRVEWEYLDGTLLLTHFNAGFNCEPTAILVSLNISGDTLFIEERDSTRAARCNCLFHVDLVVNDLNADKYFVKIDETLVSDEYPSFEFSLDLTKEQAGTQSLSRDFYPWGGQE